MDTVVVAQGGEHDREGEPDTRDGLGGERAAEQRSSLPHFDDAGALVLLGEGAEVKPPRYVDYGEHIRIGPRTFVDDNLMALDGVYARLYRFQADAYDLTSRAEP